VLPNGSQDTSFIRSGQYFEVRFIRNRVNLARSIQRVILYELQHLHRVIGRLGEDIDAAAVVSGL